MAEIATKQTVTRPASFSAISEKVTAATAAVAVSEIGVWIIESTARIDIPAGIEVAIGVVCVFAAGFFVKETLPAGTELTVKEKV